MMPLVDLTRSSLILFTAQWCDRKPKSSKTFKRAQLSGVPLKVFSHVNLRRLTREHISKNRLKSSKIPDYTRQTQVLRDVSNTFHKWTCKHKSKRKILRRQQEKQCSKLTLVHSSKSSRIDTRTTKCSTYSSLWTSKCTGLLPWFRVTFWKLVNSHFAARSKQRIKNVRVTSRGGPYMFQIFSSQKEKSMNTKETNWNYF